MTLNLLTFDAPAQTVKMTSLQIAELVEARHDSVKRTIERLAERGVIAQPPMVDVQETGGNNRSYTTTAFVFSGERGKRDSYVVVAQLSPEFTARLVDRWQALEALASKPAFQIPQTLGEALRLAADLEEQRAALALENAAKNKLIEQQQPHVEHSQALLATSEVIDMASMAQKLTQAGRNIGRNNLFVLLQEDRILKADKTPYRDYAHWFHLDTNTFTDKEGTTHSRHTLTVTAHGEKALLKKYVPKRIALRKVEDLPDEMRRPQGLGGFKKALKAANDQ
ncbi:phage antirepressor KilAC domain-containing protein [Paraburkholderia caribensis]|uniref:phage antirepressor KilAC domain-containing protein n=1 Tax=Paraburkholderia caribensis TaxID=75105 RepID=UPI00159154C2|nr:phage antirepressor KilAC domain-containing protein [Paraburkholderia caribensis]